MDFRGLNRYPTMVNGLPPSSPGLLPPETTSEDINHAMIHLHKRPATQIADDSSLGTGQRSSLVETEDKAKLCTSPPMLNPDQRIGYRSTIGNTIDNSSFRLDVLHMIEESKHEMELGEDWNERA